MGNDNGGFFKALGHFAAAGFHAFGSAGQASDQGTGRTTKRPKKRRTGSCCTSKRRSVSPVFKGGSRHD